MSMLPPSRATLQSVLDALETADVTPRRRQDLASAVRRVAKIIGRDPADIPADPQKLRAYLDAVAPAAHGLSPGRWANIRSLLNSALKEVRPMMPGRSIEPIGEPWQDLLDKVGTHRRIRLQPLLRFLTREGVMPESVGIADLERYHQARLSDCLRRDPEGTWRDLAWAWNACVRDVPGWPDVTITLPSGRQTYIRPWTDFPASLKQDVDRLLAYWAGTGLEEDGPPRPVRASTLKQREQQLRSFAAALVAKGYDPASITSVADLITLQAYKDGLRFFVERKQARDQAKGLDAAAISPASSQNGGLAAFLKAVAEHWLKVAPKTLVEMRKIVSRLMPNANGMTAKNRERLRPLDDDGFVAAFLQLPAQLRAEADSGRFNAKRSAVRAQLAVAISLLQMCGLRMQNLAGIDLQKNIHRRGDTVWLTFQEHEVKNGEPLSFALPTPTRELLDWYLDRHRRALLTGPSDALFPGEKGGPKSKHTLSTQISKTVFEHLGVPFNPHLFRSAGGKIYLDERPGQYGVVQQVLGHRDIRTTMTHYAGQEKKAAHQLYQDVVLRRLERLKAEPQRALSPHKQRRRKQGVV